MLAAAAFMGFSVGAAAQEDIFAETQPVVLAPEDPSNEEIGELIFRGGLEISPGEEEIGGISGLTWVQDRLYAVSDDGHWLSIEPDEIDGQLIDLLAVERGQLLDERGKRLRGSDNVDAEAIERAALGGWVVSFERNHRLIYYARLDGPGEYLSDPDLSVGLELVKEAEPNAGLETIAFNIDVVIACGEWARSNEVNCIRSTTSSPEQFALAPPPEIEEHQGAEPWLNCVKHPVPWGTGRQCTLCSGKEGSRETR